MSLLSQIGSLPARPAAPPPYGSNSAAALAARKRETVFAKRCSRTLSLQNSAAVKCGCKCGR